MEVKGQVVASGGGQIVIYVDRETESYPNVFDRVVMECTEPQMPLRNHSNIRNLAESLFGDMNYDEVKRIFNYGLNVDRAEPDGNHVRLDKWLIHDPKVLLHELKQTS